MSNHWIVIADSARARLFESDVELERLDFLSTLRHPQSRMKGEQLLTDSAGRDRSGTLRGANPHEHEADLFSRELARTLAEGLEQRRYERLILVAPPSFLGSLRGHLSDPVTRSVVASVRKDYSRMPTEQLLGLIRPQIPEDAGLPPQVP